MIERLTGVTPWLVAAFTSILCAGAVHAQRVSQTAESGAPDSSSSTPSTGATDSVTTSGAWLPVAPANLCNITVSATEDVATSVDLRTECDVAFEYATPLVNDRIMWLDAGAPMVHLRPRRFDGPRIAHGQWALWNEGRILGTVRMAATINDAVSEIRWAHSTTVGTPGFWLQTWLPVLDGYPQGHPDYPLLVTIPDGEGPLPVEVFLHGFMGEARFSNEADHVTIMPSDPQNTYWWGDSASGSPEPSTQWMVVDAVAQIVPTISAADADRVVLAGASMGGAGAAAIAMTWPELFAGVVATDGQAVPRNHRARRVSQLSTLWGAMSDAPLTGGQPQPAWDTTDLTWLLTTDPRIHHLPFASRFGRDDSIIHFGALTDASPTTGRSWLEAMEHTQIPWVLAWDPGGHVSSAPLEERWWWYGWNRLTDRESWWSRAFPSIAVRCSTLDGDPGDGSGNGRRPRHPDAAFAGDPAVVGDDGWNGQEQGVRGAWVRWYNRSLRAEPDSLTFDVSLHAPDVSQATCDLVIGRSGVFAPPAGAALEWSDGTETGSPAIRRSDGRIALSFVQLQSERITTIRIRWIPDGAR
jgi:pimeloyl-ACP methyl ester carboxylesterase